MTAGAGGIGLEIAKAFASSGDRVHVCDVDREALAAAAKLPGFSATECDVSNQVAVESFIQEATETLGGLDILVNNAGIAGPNALVESMDPAEWEAVLAVNLTGTFNVTRLAIPHLRQSPAGIIIIISSLAGRFGYPRRSPYAVTKRGLIAFAETLAIELGDAGIRVNAIAPGGVAGPRLERVFQARAAASGQTLDEAKKDALASQSIKRFVEPSEIAEVALFLASDAAKSITGQTLAVDGGSTSA